MCVLEKNKQGKGTLPISDILATWSHGSELLQVFKLAVSMPTVSEYSCIQKATETTLREWLATNTSLFYRR